MRIIFYIVTVLLIAFAVYFGWKASRVPKVAEVQSTELSDVRNSPFFATDLLSQGITIDTIGYHDFTPDGKHFVFSAVRDSDEVSSKAYVVNVETGEVKVLPGQILQGVGDSRIIALFAGKDLILYDFATGGEHRIPTDGNIFAGSLSPDGSSYVFDTLKGIREYVLATKELRTVSTSQYDGANVWYKDSVRMLGYKETGERIFEAGRGRAIGIWNIAEKTFQPVAVGKIDQKSIRNVTWIVPEHIARVNAGWDDGSFDYLVDLDTETVLSLGDTSGSLMGGMVDDPKRGLFAIVGGQQQEGTEVYAEIYQGINRLHRTPIAPSYFREGVVLVDQDTLLYIRKHFDAESKTIDTVELVKLDMNIGAEKVLETLTVGNYARVSVSPDNKVWVLSDGGSFNTGTVK